MHRVYIHCHRYKDFWRVQYLEPDLRTSVRQRIDRYTDFKSIEEILGRVHVESEQRAEFDDDRWGIRACFIDLTEEQYTKLKCADAITERETNRRSPRPKQISDVKGISTINARAETVAKSPSYSTRS